MRGAAADAIAAMDGHTVVAADVPSGVNASTGEVEGPAVRARATATFAAGKPGLFVNPGKEHAGEVRVIEIGIPAGAPGEPQVALIDDAVLADDPAPARATRRSSAPATSSSRAARAG